MTAPRGSLLTPSRGLAFVVYVTAGFPDLDTTRRLLPLLQQAGCDLVELGVPFSDPIADGPVIQAASTHALQNHVTLDDCLGVVEGFRRSGGTLPVVLFGALNPLLAGSLDDNLRKAAAAGVDGILCPDLPLEEAAPFAGAAAAHGLAMPLLVAPTTPDDRIAAIASASTGFLYCIAVKGITGARMDSMAEIRHYLSRVGARAAVPRLLGFGIRTPSMITELAGACEGVVVGTAFVEFLRSLDPAAPDWDGQVLGFLRPFVEAAHGG